MSVLSPDWAARSMLKAFPGLSACTGEERRQTHRGTASRRQTPRLLKPLAHSQALVKLPSLPSAWICSFHSRAQPGPAGSHWFCTASKQLTFRRGAWARSSARGRRVCLHPWLEFYPEGTESPGQKKTKTSKIIMRNTILNKLIMLHKSLLLKATLAWCSILYGVCWNCRISLMMCDI